MKEIANKPDLRGIDEIKILVDHFYLKVRHDDLLGPIFESKLAGNWQPHLQKMYRFWESVLFGARTYRGAPYLKHHSLPLEGEHFTRWMSLFTETLREFFEGPVADKALNRAQNMARMFQHKKAYYKERNTEPVGINQKASKNGQRTD